MIKHSSTLFIAFFTFGLLFIGTYAQASEQKTTTLLNQKPLVLLASYHKPVVRVRLHPRNSNRTTRTQRANQAHLNRQRAAHARARQAYYNRIRANNARAQQARVNRARMQRVRAQQARQRRQQAAHRNALRSARIQRASQARANRQRYNRARAQRAHINRMRATRARINRMRAARARIQRSRMRNQQRGPIAQQRRARSQRAVYCNRLHSALSSDANALERIKNKALYHKQKYQQFISQNFKMNAAHHARKFRRYRSDYRSIVIPFRKSVRQYRARCARS